MKKVVKRALLILNCVISGCLILAYLSVFVSPERFWPLAFFGLAFPLLVILNLLMFIFWIIRRNRYLFISLLTLILGAGYFGVFFQIPFFQKNGIDQPDNNTTGIGRAGISSPVIFLSYNVRLFNFYNWSENPEARDRIFEFISQKRPGILCLQEIYTQEKDKIPQLSIEGKSGYSGYSHIAYASGTSLKGKYGIATFTAFPILSRGEIRYPETNNLSIYTDLAIYEDTVRIYNNHLQSIKLRKKNYDFIETLNTGDEEETMDEILDISFRLRNAFRKRAQQADILADHILSSPYPVIVCGDFNDTPVSYTYRKIRGNLRDAFIESGGGLGNTYLGKFPSYRIDYILHSKNINSGYFETSRVNYSDHYPVSCIFEVKREDDQDQRSRR
ncbi:MAG: endonuclease/exonuclease/phosphatase family protein [Bacteroidales bacterium]|nr:MAG: endonuclease/exonuclease/phosphatase family protein [Bacteroidales bacterium]